ncbi:MAG: hypothetical protein RR177_06850, partial [Oscillospiraceae bacterium]
RVSVISDYSYLIRLAENFPKSRGFFQKRRYITWECRYITWKINAEQKAYHEWCALSFQN